jgi:GT2 family glycosyltransferase
LSISVSCVVLTLGDRTSEVDRAVRSVLGQHGDRVEVLVIGNGCPVPPLSESVKTLHIPENVGIPSGRNRGVEETTGEVILFLDDDGWYPSPDLVEHLRTLLAADPTLGIVSFRVVDEEGETARRHVPRLRTGDPLRSSDVTLFLGGGCAIRREVFQRCGGYPDEFWYAHEEIDLAWRALDSGYRIRYDAESVMRHPRTSPTRHPLFWRLNARNRVWLARRRLPWPLAFTYLAVWTLITLARLRSRTNLRAWFSGFGEGWREPCGVRRPMRWRTAWRMTRLGRPPII